MTPETTDDAPLWAALEQSALGRVSMTVAAPFLVAARASRLVTLWRQWPLQWRALSAHAQMQAAGTMMIVATLVHIGLAAIRQPVGYWWLIVPGTALMFGLTALALSRLGRSSR